MGNHLNNRSTFWDLQTKWWVLIAIGTSTFMSALDTSVVNTILPVIQENFGSDVATIEWIVTVYLLVVSGLLLSFGRLGDIRGHKSVFLTGFVIFIIASALCGLAPSAGALIAYTLCPTVKDYMFAGHCSEEPGHRIMLKHMGLEPILDLGMRLGEGTGGALAMTVMEGALKVFKEVATFEEAGVTSK